MVAKRRERNPAAMASDACKLKLCRMLIAARWKATFTRLSTRHVLISVSCRIKRCNVCKAELEGTLLYSLKIAAERKRDARKMAVINRLERRVE